MYCTMRIAVVVQCCVSCTTIVGRVDVRRPTSASKCWRVTSIGVMTGVVIFVMRSIVAKSNFIPRCNRWPCWWRDGKNGTTPFIVSGRVGSSDWSSVDTNYINVMCEIIRIKKLFAYLYNRYKLDAVRIS